jgi:hypothetical protein
MVKWMDCLLGAISIICRKIGDESKIIIQANAPVLFHTTEVILSRQCLQRINHYLYNEEYWGKPGPVYWYEVLDETFF